MQKYFCSILILGNPVMCATIEASGADEAKKTWEAKFWADPDTFRAAIPAMDDTNRECAVKLLSNMEATRESAKAYGITVTARLSRSKAEAFPMVV